MTSKLSFRNSETLQWKNENKKTELSNLKILLEKKFPSCLTLFFLFSFSYFKISELCNSEVWFSLNASPKRYRPFLVQNFPLDQNWVEETKTSINYKILRMLLSNMDFSLAHFTNFNFAHFEIEERFVDFTSKFLFRVFQMCLCQVWAFFFLILFIIEVLGKFG